jgi:hypothetical protein
VATERGREAKQSTRWRGRRKIFQATPEDLEQSLAERHDLVVGDGHLAVQGDVVPGGAEHASEPNIEHDFAGLRVLDSLEGQVVDVAMGEVVARRGDGDVELAGQVG